MGRGDASPHQWQDAISCGLWGCTLLHSPLYCCLPYTAVSVAACLPPPPIPCGHFQAGAQPCLCYKDPGGCEADGNQPPYLGFEYYG